MEERIDLLVEQKPRAGVSIASIVSLVVHTLLVTYLIHAYHPVTSQAPAPPMVRYVELMRQNRPDFVEAPGRKVKEAPLNAPMSDANRRASMPEPTGDKPTLRPGEGERIWSPPPQRSTGDGRQPTPSSQQPPSAQQHQAADAKAGDSGSSGTGLTYRQSVQTADAGDVDWRQAIRQVGQAGSGSGQRGLDLGGAGGGEKGFAESGPLSFETQWYDWGEYAASMVSRIRVNWYSNMPQLIRTGMKGVVTIRFTIHRDGQITDVVILNSSGIPPYDNAAAQAIRLSSPLRPLPKDFPNDTERVTCMFYYNMEIPR